MAGLLAIADTMNAVRWQRDCDRKKPATEAAVVRKKVARRKRPPKTEKVSAKKGKK